MKSVFKGFNLDENGKVEGAYPNFQTKIQEQMAIMSKEANEYTMKILSRLNIDPDVLVKQKAEIDRLSFENEQLKQQIEEMKNCYNCSNFCDRNIDCSSICVRNNPTVKQLKDYWKMKDIY